MKKTDICIVISINNNDECFGINTDYYILQNALDCHILNIKSLKHFSRDFNILLFEYKKIIFIETHLFAFLNIEDKKKKIFYFIPNYDIYPIVEIKDVLKEKYKLIDYIIARNKNAKEIAFKEKKINNYNYLIIETRFSSIDYSKYYIEKNYLLNELSNMNKITEKIFSLKPNIITYPKERVCLYLGKKNSEYIINYWKKMYNEKGNKIPILYIKIYPSEKMIEYNFKENEIKYNMIPFTVISEKKKQELLNRCLWHINLSQNEGYGHTVNEGRSTGCILLLDDIFSKLYEISNYKNIQLVVDLKNNLDFINNIFNLNDEHIKKIQISNKKDYENDTNIFVKTIKNIFK